MVALAAHFIGEVMINTSNGFWIIAVVALGVIPKLASADEKTKVDRAPLTHRDSGLYCNLGFTNGQDIEDDRLSNMLKRERASSADAPWSFYVFQLDGRAHIEDAKMINRMVASGKRVILRVDVGRLSPNPNVDEM